MKNNIHWSAFIISPDVKNEMAKHKCTNFDSLMFVTMLENEPFDFKVYSPINLYRMKSTSRQSQKKKIIRRSRLCYQSNITYIIYRALVQFNFLFSLICTIYIPKTAEMILEKKEGELLLDCNSLAASSTFVLNSANSAKCIEIEKY
ncbi:hypothetical protein Bhyg_06465 [Pseudolycoriella hygida]|uniref:Uncharacterized protein n=1 Tax=Pseudolycoriella hygida TaxID=35572 RepID=A0A9Q0N2D6_9DIPT|nr:hypothetical protein Bhyg_06465 [Pseudolycoriella hygida]